MLSGFLTSFTSLIFLREPRSYSEFGSLALAQMLQQEQCHEHVREASASDGTIPPPHLVADQVVCRRGKGEKFLPVALLLASPKKLLSLERVLLF